MSRTLAKFYSQTRFQPAWIEEGCLLPRVEGLLRALRQSDGEGLNPDEYHLREIARLRSAWPAGSRAQASDLIQQADLDLVLTDAALLYASHLLGGHTNLVMARAQWALIKKKADLVTFLETALASNNAEEALAALAPAHAGYARLREALERYRQMKAAGGWPTIPEGPVLKRGQEDPRVPLLRARLEREEFIPIKTSTSAVYGAELEKAVRRFQRAYGHDGDGRVGDNTRAALNVPVEDRIHQIKFNMDRWRWLPGDLGLRHIVVNIPAFALQAFENGRQALPLPVIVGKNNDENATPVFSDKMSTIEFSPAWNVPKDIAAKEMLELIQRDPSYLKRHHLQVLQGSADPPVIVDPKTVDWCDVTPNYFPFRLRQTPGPWNVLGQVKFMFPNQYNIYIHGNIEEGLFAKRLRAYSHGCVRVMNPVRLAQFVLTDPDWTDERIKALMHQKEPVIVSLPDPVPVYLLYWSAWVDEEGRVNFREDIYGRDRELKEQFYAGE